MVDPADEKIGSVQPFGLRMPADVRAWVESNAAELERSKNWIIIKALRRVMENGQLSQT